MGKNSSHCKIFLFQIKNKCLSVYFLIPFPFKQNSLSLFPEGKQKKKNLEWDEKAIYW
jgi:hypothetical protein